jgi:hypothetical protein
MLHIRTNTPFLIALPDSAAGTLEARTNPLRRDKFRMAAKSGA